ncbi:MAG: hydroxyacid dehydrogenase [Candidatus Eisenbacteria bacterium]|nr:hydroxyacid dehydrogenase [Candidatus Eisenbacteria bacterium]
MMTSGLKVYMHERPGEGALERLRELLDEGVELSFGPEPPERADYDVLVAGVPTERELDASDSLRVLIIPWAGLAQSTRRALLGRERLLVHNIHHNAAPAAELALALMLAAAKAVVPVDQKLREHDWSPRYEPDMSVLLERRNALVLGYGEIGKRIAGGCRGIGMSVTALRRHPEKTPADCSDRVLPASALRHELPRADVLHVALPHTDATRGLLGSAEMELLPTDCVLVNIARGPIVDEKALYRALASGAIRAAGLDVWYSYPKTEEERSCTPPSRFPFHELPNVVMSPHRGGAFSVGDVERARAEALAASLNAAARGAPIPHPVDVREGY